MDTNLIINNWIEIIQNYSLKFQEIDEDIASVKSHHDKWSNKEVLGHLCDSAINNYMRIMNLIITNGNCILQSYAQDEWVKNAAYQNRNWNSIIDLWRSLNYSFINLVENTSNDAWQFQGNYKGESQSFEFLVTDYIDHMKHHFNQIFTNNISIN